MYYSHYLTGLDLELTYSAFGALCLNFSGYLTTLLIDLEMSSYRVEDSQAALLDSLIDSAEVRCEWLGLFI